MSQRAWIAQTDERVFDEPTVNESARRTVYVDDGEDDGHPTRANAYPSAPRAGSLDSISDDENPTLFRARDEVFEQGDADTHHGFESGPVPTDATRDDHEDPYDDGPEELADVFAPPPRAASEPPPLPKSKGSVWDAVESRYRTEGHWSDLVEMYLQRVETANEPREKVDLFKKIGRVLREEMEDAQQSLDAYVEALVLAPRDAEAIDAIESIARAKGWWLELFSTLKRELRDVTSKERELGVCELCVRWARDELGQAGRADAFLDRIRRIDPGHPAVQRRLAEQYREQGNWEAQREALERALPGLREDGDRRYFHLSLGELNEQRFGDVARALRHYDAAVQADGRSIAALQGLERIFRVQERYVDLALVLEQQVDAAPDARARVEALLRLADVQERHFVSPALAVPRLEEALQIDPANDAALEALERCYLATRSWADLVRILERRVELTERTQNRLPVIGRIAEVLELQIGDAEGAAQAWGRVWDLDPANEGALSELARLAERAQDWAAAAAYRAKLADLAPSPEAAARIHVAIGELLAPPDRDPALARRHFEKAALVHPATPQAWEALEREARKSGDAKRAAIFLEKRAASTESPRQKAQLFVELAQMQKDLGDAEAAELAYERAIKADGTNEIAADAMLGAHVRGSRWAEAQPLCDLLVAAASRDGNGERAWALLRTGTRIARELGQTERMLSSALAAWRARGDVESALDLVDAAYLAKADAALRARVLSELDRIAEHAMELGPAAIAKLARVQLLAGNDDQAAALFAKALTQDAEQKDALEGLAEILVAREEWDRACSYKKKLAHCLGAPDEQFKLLIEAGEMWAHRAGNLPMAVLAFEEALGIKPADSWLLHTLMWAYGELACWEKLVETLQAVAGLHEDPVAKAKSLYAMALVVRDRLNDLPRASRLLEEVLDLDPKRLDAFERIVRAHTELRDWMELKHAYGRMLRRLKTDKDVHLRYTLFFQLGLIYRDRLADAARALDAFRAAQRLKPDDDDVRKAMTELFVVSDQLDEAVTMVRAALKKKPQDPALYRELYELFLRQRSFDKGWCALDALATLGAPLDAEQVRFYEDYPPPSLSQIPGTVTASAWRSHILHPGLDPSLTKIFALVTPIVLRARSLMLPFAQLRRTLGEPLRETNAVSHEVVEAVHDGAEILALPAPSLHIRESQPVPLALAPAKNAVFVSLERCEALPSDALAFVVGKRLAEMRPELAARAACPSLTELKALVVIAVQLSDERVSAPTTGNAAFDKALVQAMTREEQLALRAAINAAKAQGSELDVARWAQLADMSAARVGLLLAGHIEAARRGMMGDPQLAGDLSPRQKLSEMLLFSVSDEYADLRHAIGVGVNANAAA
jgi:tetratricopeptide (TPR) repeat protein